MVNRLRQKLASEQGQGALEYLAIAAIFVLIVLIAFEVLNADISYAACQELRKTIGDSVECL